MQDRFLTNKRLREQSLGLPFRLDDREISNTCTVVYTFMNYFIYKSFHSSRENELNKLTSLPMYGFIAQLVEHRTDIAEVTGSNPVEALIF